MSAEPFLVVGATADGEVTGKDRIAALLRKKLFDTSISWALVRLIRGAEVRLARGVPARAGGHEVAVVAGFALPRPKTVTEPVDVP